MKQPLDLTTWNRREHFAFFSKFEEPFFGLVGRVDCTRARAAARRQGVSFFLYYLHCSLRAANQVPEFRYRIEDGAVFVHDRVHASATIGRPDHTFGFALLDYHDELPDFLAAAGPVVEAVRAASGLCLSAATARPDVLHCSAVPWVRFSGLTHARSFRHPDSCPKLSYGQFYEEAGATYMPVAVNVHHGLADGYHVGQFLAAFQQGLDGEMMI